MNNTRLLAGLVLASLALTACGSSERDLGNSILKLPGCVSTDTPFQALQLDSAVSAYHSTVARVIDAHLNELEDITSVQLKCTANDYRGLLQPSEELRFLAEQLPEWGSSRTAELSEADLAPVLLEYLRTYECALRHRAQFLPVLIATGATMERSALLKENVRQRSIIDRELSTARPALDKTIAFLGGIDRLRPLSAELECLKRASLDLRNTFGNFAGAAQCLPKIWDARGSLRDLAE